MSSEGGISGRASGGQLEERVDLSSETDLKIGQATTLAESGQLSEALSLLGALEKKCRVGNDNASLVRVCETSLKLCYANKDDDASHEALIHTLQSLSTRRSQKTVAIRALVQTALPWCIRDTYTPLPVNSVAEKNKRDLLVKTLLDITEGKIFLERERAQFTRALATIKEEEGDVAAAADILQDVHVETFGTLSKRDKVEFILEQMRLTLAKKDFVRAHIVANKISRKHLQEETMEEYKVKFFSLMTIYHRAHKQEAFELAKDYHSIYSTPHILNQVDKWKEALKATVVFLALSPYGNEQQDMMNRIALDTNLQQIPSFKACIQLFLKKEIIHYPMPFQAELEQVPQFLYDDLAPHWHQMFHKRIIQHNIRVVSTYYKQIRLERCAQLLQLEPAQLEQEIASMVSDGSIYAKMDRPRGIVRFSAPKSPEAILSDWAADIEKMLHLVETTSHLINKENMTAQ